MQNPCWILNILDLELVGNFHVYQQKQPPLPPHQLGSLPQQTDHQLGSACLILGKSEKKTYSLKWWCKNGNFYHNVKNITLNKHKSSGICFFSLLKNWDLRKASAWRLRLRWKRVLLGMEGLDHKHGSGTWLVTKTNRIMVLNETCCKIMIHEWMLNGTCNTSCIWTTWFSYCFCVHSFIHHICYSELTSFVLSRRYSEQTCVGTYPRHSYPLGSQTKSPNFEYLLIFNYWIPIPKNVYPPGN